MKSEHSKKHSHEGARASKPRGGTGAHGARHEPGADEAQHEGPAWRGGGKKGENEPPRSRT